MYQSREERVGKTLDESLRLDYEDGEGSYQRLLDTSLSLADCQTELDDALADYDISVQEWEQGNQIPQYYEDVVRHREKVIQAWAALQFQVSKLGWQFRFDGNKALERFVDGQSMKGL